MTDRIGVIGVAVVALATALLLTGINLYWGELNQDEGWYLYAARLVAEGAVPYRDFAFTQGPVFTRVYAWAHGCVAEYGLMGSRLFTATLGLFSILLAAGAAARLAPTGRAAHAALLVVILLGGNVYHSYFSLVVKTYSLSALFIMAGALALTFLPSRFGLAAVTSTGFLWALSAGVRLSSGILLVVGGFGLLLHHRRYPFFWLAFGCGGLAGLLIAFLPAWLTASEHMKFWLLDYHTARDAGSFGSQLVYKAGFLSRFVQAYFVLVALALALLVWACARPSVWKNVIPVPVQIMLGGFLAGSLVHLSAPFPYDDYQVFLVPLLAVPVAWGVAVLLRDCSGRSSFLALGAVYMVATAAAFSSPMNQQWFVRERDRIWWRLKEKPDLVVLQEAGRWLRQRAALDDFLLTHDTYLAVESGMRVWPGMEMGPFSYFPDWPREDAEKRHVMNRKMLLEALSSDRAMWAAVSGYGLAIRSPSVSLLEPHEQQELQDTLLDHFIPVKVIPSFGQAHTELILYRAKDEQETP